jgi:hypothetical protein
MKARDWAWPVVIILAVLAAAGWYYYKPMQRAQPSTAATEVPPPPAAEAAASAPAAGPQYPVPESPGEAAGAAPAAPLPSLAASDPDMRQSLIGVFDAAPIDAFLVPQDIVRRFVAMIDNLTEPTLPMRVRSIRKIGGSFAVQQTGDGAAVLSPSNSARYSGFVEATQLADAQRCAQIYFHYYPLFQAAYEELGHKNQYFNDRLVQVIDHLLAAPEVDGPIALQRPKVFYQFADPELESRSAGQKAMIRIGAENAEVIKAKLRQLRAEIVKHPPPAAAPQ